MITLSNPIQIIKQFNPSYSYPMDYEIYNTHDFDINTLNDYGQVISFRFIRNQSNASELTAIFYLGDSLTQQEETISRTTTVKTFWFTDHVKRFRLVYKGLTAVNANKIVELNYSYGNDTRINLYPSGISFTSYHTGIKKCLILKESLSGSGTAAIKLYVVDQIDVAHCYEGTVNTAIGTTIINNWGELCVQGASAISLLPTGVLTELNITEASGIAPLTDIYTDRWFPSYNGCTAWDVYSETVVVDDKENLHPNYVEFIQYEYDASYLRKLIDDNLSNNNSPQINSIFTTALSYYISNHRRMGLLISPSTIPLSSAQEGICVAVEIDGETCYHSLPTWLYTAVSSLGKNVGYYVSQWNDSHTGDLKKFVFLNWANSTVRGYFIDCVNTVANYINSNPDYKKHIEFIKVSFLGTWGEGYSLANPPAACIPSANDLLEVAQAICTAFGNDYIYVWGLRTSLNGEFPLNFRNAMIAEGKGLYNDSVNNITNDWFLNGMGTKQIVTLSEATPTLMNHAFRHTKSHLTTIEAEPYLEIKTSNNTGNNYFADLVAHAYYYNPDYFSLHNVLYKISIGSLSGDSVRILNDIKELSHFVGTRPFLIKTTVTLLPQSLYVNIKIGNYGTALIRSYWKLRFYIESPAGIIINENNPIESGLNLQMVPKAFEPGVPNRYDTIQLTQSYSINLGVNQTVGYRVLAAIEDGDNIYPKRLMLCNTTSSLPRETANGVPTGRFYLT